MKAEHTDSNGPAYLHEWSYISAFTNVATSHALCDLIFVVKFLDSKDEEIRGFCTRKLFGKQVIVYFMVAPCVNYILNFIFQLMYTNCKILRLLKYLKL